MHRRPDPLGCRLLEISPRDPPPLGSGVCGGRVVWTGCFTVFWGWVIEAHGDPVPRIVSTGVTPFVLASYCTALPGGSKPSCGGVIIIIIIIGAPRGRRTVYDAPLCVAALPAALTRSCVWVRCSPLQSGCSPQVHHGLRIGEACASGGRSAAHPGRKGAWGDPDVPDPRIVHARRDDCGGTGRPDPVLPALR